MDLAQIIFYLVSGIFYIVTAILAFLGAFTIYIFIRYGRSPIVAIIVSVMFAVMFLIISGNAVQLLNKA